MVFSVLMVGSLNINLLNGDVLVSCKMASLKLAVGIFVCLFWGLVAFCKQKKKKLLLFTFLQSRPDQRIQGPTLHSQTPAMNANTSASIPSTQNSDTNSSSRRIENGKSGFHCSP